MTKLKKNIRGSLKLEDVRIFNQNGTDSIESLEVLGIDRFNKVWGIPFESIGGGNSSGGTVVETTYTELVNTLIPNAELIPGAFYKILDADVNLYGGTEIILTAITSNQLSLQGSGKFYCPKYDLTTAGNGYGIWTKHMEGTFGTITGTFTTNETVTANNGATGKYLAEGLLEWISGDWSGATSISGATATADVLDFISPSYTVGQVVHWGGKSWSNVNGNIGASVDKYTLDTEWIEIPFNATDYNVYIDEIQYDFGNDMIIYRKDRYNNVVSGSNQVFVEFESPYGYNYGNPIKDFQWGCAQDNFNTDDYLYVGIQSNQVIDSYCETLNFRGKYFWFNSLENQSYISYNTLSNSSNISNNTLSNSSGISNNTLSNSRISSNTLSSSNISNNTLSHSNISNNTLSSRSNISYNTLSSSSNIYNNTLSSSYISNNTLSSSNISNNTLSSSYIYNNTLSRSYIYNNTLSLSNIYNNTLSNSRISSNTLGNSSGISNNTLSNSSNISNNTLSNSNISDNTLSKSNISNNTLNISIFSFSDISTNILNCRADSFNTSATIISLSGSTILGTSYNKVLFNNSANIPRLQYVNNSDVIVITDVDA